MSVVRDFMKLRKYNIHEVNEKIFQSQRTDNEDSEKVKSKNQTIMKSDDNDADSGAQRDGNNAGSDMNRDGNNADSTTVDDATSENPDTWNDVSVTVLTVGNDGKIGEGLRKVMNSAHRI